jgi:hypothetical protein
MSMMGVDSVLWIPAVLLRGPQKWVRRDGGNCARVRDSIGSHARRMAVEDRGRDTPPGRRYSLICAVGTAVVCLYCLSRCRTAESLDCGESARNVRKRVLFVCCFRGCTATPQVFAAHFISFKKITGLEKSLELSRSSNRNRSVPIISLGLKQRVPYTAIMPGSCRRKRA